MTTSRQYGEGEGAFISNCPSDKECPNCNSVLTRYKEWESSDGAYTDYKYNCLACGHVWWVDGPDS